MKKIYLVAASALLALTAYASDGNTYNQVSGINCKNIWIKAQKFNVDAFKEIPLLSSNRCRSAVIYKGKVYVASSANNLGSIEVLDAETGAYIKQIPVMYNDAQVKELLCITQVGIDSYGNLWASPYIASNKWGTKVYIIDKETGVATRRLLTMTTDGRIDHMDVVGDLTLKQDDCVIMGASSTNDYTVYRWHGTKGADEDAENAEKVFTGGWDENKTDSKVVTGAFPADTKWNNPPALKFATRTSDDEELGKYFYIQSVSCHPTLFDNTGAMVESMEKAPTGIAPNSITAAGVEEFTLGTRRFLAFSNNDNGGTNGGNDLKIVEYGKNRSMESLSECWILPKTGLGAVSDGQCYNHAIDTEKIVADNGKEAVNLVTFKNQNGMAVYQIYEEGFGGVDSAINDSNIEIKALGNKVVINENATEVSLYNAAGQLVTTAKNCTEVEVASKGFYIVKAVVNGKTATAKVIL